MIVILDYGMGNLSSVKHALDYLNLDNKISKNPADIENADGLILPGVGSFNDAMNIIEDAGMDKIIRKETAKNKPILGICLGMQLLFEKGYEVNEKNGLGLLKGKIVRMNADKQENIKIPHIGWNNLIYSKKDYLTKDVEEGKFVYYVHSYCAEEYDPDDLIAYSKHGQNKIVSIIRHKNIIGMQFHPEKSGDVGIKLLKNFGELIKC